MQQKYILSLFAISFVLTNIVAFLDEGIRTFDYLKHGGDWVALLMYTVVFLIIPLLLFFGINKKNYYRRFVFSLFGFAPTVMLILLQMA